MKLLRTSIAIAAPPKVVWAVLVGLDRYPEWNAVIPQLSGRFAVGERLEGIIAFTGLGAMPFTPQIVRIHPERILCWSANAPDGSYTAEHCFRLVTFEDGTLFENDEAFDGLLVDSVIWPMMKDLGRRDYEAMNAALKVHSESIVRDRACT